MKFSSFMFQYYKNKAVYLFCISLMYSNIVVSHPLSVSYSQFRVEENRLAAVYRLPMDDMDLLLQLDSDLDEIVTQQEIELSTVEINNYIRTRSNLSLNNEQFSPGIPYTSIWLDSDDFPYLEVGVEYTSTIPINTAAITLRFLTDLYPDHRILAELDDGNEELQFVFQHENTWSWERDNSSVWTTAIGFVLFGMEHILIGYDHILFLLGLLLVAKGFRNLVIIVTAFTVAHTLTLALATLGIVEPIGRLVEAAIALSIMYVGIENLVVKDIKNRWIVAFVFGLVHGFGFAGLLQQMDLEKAGLLTSLLTFNLGVEIGQITIIVIAWPLIQKLTKTVYRKQIIQLVSLVITLFGLLWFVQRVI